MQNEDRIEIIPRVLRRQQRGRRQEDRTDVKEDDSEEQDGKITKCEIYSVNFIVQSVASVQGK